MKRIVLGLVLLTAMCAGAQPVTARGPKADTPVYKSGYGGYIRYRPYYPAPYPYYVPPNYPPPRVYYPLYRPPVVGGYYNPPGFGFYFGGR